MAQMHYKPLGQKWVPVRLLSSSSPVKTNVTARISGSVADLERLIGNICSAALLSIVQLAQVSTDYKCVQSSSSRCRHRWKLPHIQFYEW